MEKARDNRFQKVYKIEKLKSTTLKASSMAQRPLRQDSERDYNGLFRGWFNNRMTVLLLIVQNPKFRPPQTMQRIEFFLEEIEHHFVDSYAPKSIQNAFRYLKRYFGIYPNVSEIHCRRAMEMVGRIYQALGLKFGFQPDRDELPFFKKQQIEADKTVFNAGIGI